MGAEVAAAAVVVEVEEVAAELWSSDCSIESESMGEVWESVMELAGFVVVMIGFDLVENLDCLFFVP